MALSENKAKTKKESQILNISSADQFKKLTGEQRYYFELHEFMLK